MILLIIGDLISGIMLVGFGLMVLNQTCTARNYLRLSTMLRFAVLLRVRTMVHNED